MIIDYINNIRGNVYDLGKAQCSFVFRGMPFM